jgi:hypothetical protein
MNNSQKVSHVAPLQKLTVRPIVDPAERAALQASVKRSVRGESAVAAALEWCELFTPEDRFKVVVALISEMSDEQCTELKNMLTAQRNGTTRTPDNDRVKPESS